ncbi:MAG: hypothetical protein QOJ73_5770 [Streptosporangiaceae bacterium]|jgi:hypothetical protein|nr:hypothetical protein [Streptosporangiaceae bacterium]
MARITPLLDTYPAGGQVVVTRFECRTLFDLLALRVMHVRLKIDVRRHARGFVGIKVLTDWRSRTLLSISLWRDLDSVYSMGDVPRHISAVRVSGTLAEATACGIFCFVGDWRHVMFRDPAVASSPLYPLKH